MSKTIYYTSYRKYLKIYIDLCRKAIYRELFYPFEKSRKINYYEEHHIFPVSLFGKNKTIIKLTAREHFIAHLLLSKICELRYGLSYIKTRKMNHALGSMSSWKNRRQFNSHTFEKCAIAAKKARYGKKLTEETKKKLSIIFSGEGNYFYGKKFLGPQNHFYGKHHTEKTKNKIRKSLKNSDKTLNIKNTKQKNSRNYLIIKKNGYCKIIFNLSDWCEKNNYNYNTLRRISCKDHKQKFQDIILITRI